MGCAAGSLACALLVINNLRDIPTDREVGKKTLAVRLGDQRTRWFYVMLIAVGFVLVRRRRRVVAGAGAARARLPIPLAVGAVTGGPAATGIRPRPDPVLGATGRLQLAFGPPGASIGLVSALTRTAGSIPHEARRSIRRRQPARLTARHS